MEGKVEIDFAINAGEMLLKSGAETYRVGETIKRICQKKGFELVEVFVFPTGIIVNGIYKGIRLTSMKQITHRNINLTMISRINNISRKYATGDLEACEGLVELDKLSGNCCFPKRTVRLAGACASVASTFLLGGSWADLLPTFAASMLVWLVMDISISNFPSALKIYLAGMIVGICAATFVHKGFGQHLDKIVVGSVLPLMPGLALTSAIRDLISGDLLSGTIRSVETLLTTTTLAVGVATGLSAFTHLVKGVL